MKKRIYRVVDGAGLEQFVRAPTRASAVAHVARNTFTATLATQEDLARLIGTNTQIQNVEEEPEPEPAAAAPPASHRKAA